MTIGLPGPCWTATRSSFDALVERVGRSRLSFEEDELLRDTHWSLGEDARLREDVRFRPTPWGRWISATSYLANDALFAQLHREAQGRPGLEELLAELDGVVARRCVFCPGDPRFVLEGGTLRLSARELTDQPLVERDVTDLEKYATHLPVHSLRAAAASAPAGQWGRRAQEQVIETLGWVRVSVGRKLNPRMFVAQIEGKSMDDGRSGLVDGGYAVFELWPEGSEQPRSVLVRGAFTDPETGSYAVKKYVAGDRDEEGRLRRVTLVSLNPDKERYPDIDLDVANSDEVSVVAEVVQALSPDQFARRPRPMRRPGRRDLSSAESVAEIGLGLEAHTQRFFEALPDGEEGKPEQVSSWKAELVCLETEAGGLHLEAGPLVGLWGFVKQLRVQGAASEASVLASNLRLRPVRVPVAPSAGPWKWVAVGHEDDPDLDFSGLAVPALPVDAAVAFRVDAAGVGRRMAGRSLSAGQCYRLLLPEGVLGALAHRPPVSPAGPGWHLWELDLGSTVLPAVPAALRELGLDVGETDARLDWVLIAPVAWRTSPRGEPYPCFLPTPAPVLSVSGPGVDAEGSARLFLHGPNGHEAMPLPPGRRHLTKLQDLDPGRYSAMVLHDRTGIPPERLAFEILDAPPAAPAARWQVSALGKSAAPRPGAMYEFPARDLVGLERGNPEDPEPLELAAPPGWPVRILWREVAEDLILTTHAARDGLVDANAVRAASREPRARHLVGDLVFDFAELGAAVLKHERRLTPETVRNRIKELVSTKGSTAQRLVGSYSVLLPLWFDPICSALGYDLEAVPLEGATPPPDHVAACRLQHTERRGSTIERHPVRLLVLVEDLTKPLSDPLLAWVDALCVAERLREVLLSDGLRWARRRIWSHLELSPWDLSEASKDPEQFNGFLREAAEGI